MPVGSKTAISAGTPRPPPSQPTIAVYGDRATAASGTKGESPAAIMTRGKWFADTIISLLILSNERVKWEGAMVPGYGAQTSPAISKT